MQKIKHIVLLGFLLLIVLIFLFFIKYQNYEKKTLQAICDSKSLIYISSLENKKINTMRKMLIVDLAYYVKNYNKDIYLKHPLLKRICNDLKSIQSYLYHEKDLLKKSFKDSEEIFFKLDEIKKDCRSSNSFSVSHISGGSPTQSHTTLQ